MHLVKMNQHCTNTLYQLSSTVISDWWLGLVLMTHMYAFCIHWVDHKACCISKYFKDNYSRSNHAELEQNYKSNNKCTKMKNVSIFLIHTVFTVCHSKQVPQKRVKAEQHLQASLKSLWMFIKVLIFFVWIGFTWKFVA